MDEDSIKELFTKDKLLVRAMDVPGFYRVDNTIASDFSTWAEEIDTLKNEGLTSLSSTLLVAGEKTATYKSMGFIINSDLAEIGHVAETDSGSNGNVRNGDFSANETDISTLSELATRIRDKHSREMNEVNINIKQDAIVGLFVNKTTSERPKAQILLAQEYYKMQTGKELPIFTYDSQTGSLTPLNSSSKEKEAFLIKACEDKTIRSSTVYYYIDTNYTKEEKSLDVLNKSKARDNEEELTMTDHVKGLSYEGINSKTTPKKQKIPYKSTQDNSSVKNWIMQNTNKNQKE